jgi:hypothetical protein
MELIARGTGNRIDITLNGDQWWLERVGSNVWELWHLNDMQPTETYEHNNKGRVLALAIFRIINEGGTVPA